MFDYVSMLGLELLSAASGRGRGVRVAVLDSGTPSPNSGVRSPHARCADGQLVDTVGHATAVASILSGSDKIRGLCECAEFLYIPVLGKDGIGSVGSVSDGILKAIDCDADIINLSAGFARTKTCPKRLESACDNAFESKKVIICAAGNDGGPVNWPAALETTISVGSSDRSGIRTSFSSVGEVDFVAPGTDLDVIGLDGEIRKVYGTSFSSAIVSGVAALLVAGMHRNDHSPGADAVISALLGMAKDVDEPGWDELTGYGAIGYGDVESCVCMKINHGFFGRILDKLKSLIGLNHKEKRNGSTV